MSSSAGGDVRPFWFSATLLIPTGRGGALVWWPAEIEVPVKFSEADAFDYLNKVLVEDGTIRVTKLETDFGEDRVRVITKRVPIILGIGAVATLTPLHVDLRDPDAE